MRRYDRSQEKENEARQEEERGRHGKERTRATGEQKGKEQTDFRTCTGTLLHFFFAASRYLWRR